MAMQPPPVPRVPGAPVAARPPVAPPQTPPGAMPPGAAMPQMPGEELVAPRTIWQHPFMQDVMPFLTSFILHFGIIALIVATVSVVHKVLNAKANQEQVIVPTAELADGPEGGIPNPGLGSDPSRSAAQDKFPDVPPDASGWSDKKATSDTVMAPGGGSGDGAVGESAIGQGGPGIGRGNGGLGAGSGTGFGSGEGDGSGPLAPYGLPGGGGGIGPKCAFFGAGGNARRIAYVCDASGSMVSKFDDLRMEIRKSVTNLKMTQSYNVIFFPQKEGAPPISLGQSLLMASPENKAKTNSFLESTTSHGETFVISALELAFKQKPQLIYLLSDGDFPNNDEVVKWIADRNKGTEKIKINTIAFVGKGDEFDSFKKIMKKIAQDSGGVFKDLSETEFGQR